MDGQIDMWIARCILHRQIDFQMDKRDKERKIDEQIDRCIVGQLHEQIDEQKVLKNRQLYKQIDGQLNRFEYIFNIKYLQVTT